MAESVQWSRPSIATVGVLASSRPERARQQRGKPVSQIAGSTSPAVSDQAEAADETTRSAVREGITMALYVAISLLAVLIGLPAGTLTEPVREIFFTALGLLMAHTIAFQLSARILAAVDSPSKPLTYYLVDFNSKSADIVGEEYPQLPQVEGDSVKVSITALRSVLPAVGQNDARYVLNGALLDFTKGLAIGTDGHRLHMADIEKQDRSNIILPRTAAEIISKHGGNEVTFQVRDNKFTCKLADGDMTGKLIDGNYPNYEQVIPVSAPITVEFSAKDMMKVFEGCLPIINQKSHAVAFIVNGKIEVQATSSERGIYKWHVPGTITGKGPDELKIGFNVLYLQDAFRAYAGAEGAGVTMAMSDPLSPCLIACPRTSESGGKAVVMPMRV
jgi:DNA polymerase-3 subunit beta